MLINVFETMRARITIILLIVIMAALTGCAGSSGADYTQITQEEAQEMMQLEDMHRIIDVRTHEEYNDGHIPGAICIPNETIGTDPPEELPDKDQVLLIYCRSGNRSKDASQKLANMGYTNVYEFGGINTWTGEIVSEQNNGENAQNAGQTGNNMKLRIDDTEIPVRWEKNVSVSELKSLVKNEPITIQMSMYGDFEQVGPIGQSITSNDKQITAKAGDIVLYSGDQIVIFYGTNSWDYTMLGHVDMAEDELTELLSNGDVKVTIQQNKEMAGQ